MSAKGRIYLILAVLLLLGAVVAYFYPFDRTPPEVIVSPSPGAYKEEIQVSFSSEPGAVIWFAPGPGAPVRYLKPFPLRRDAQIRYYAVDKAGNRSSEQIASFSVRIDNVPPVTSVSPPGGKYFHPVSVRLTTEEGAVIRYTLDGSEPGEASAVYREPLALSEARIVKFYATDAAGNKEQVRAEDYRIVIDTTRPHTLADPAGGIFAAPVTVRLTVTKPNSRIHLTQDGSKPTARSPVYSSPVTLNRSGSLRFFAVDEAGNVEDTREERYVIDTEPPRVAASPRGVSSNRPLEVTLSSSEPAVVRYELDGEAGDSSPVYKGPIRIDRSATLTFLAVDRAGNRSPVAREAYVVDTAPPVTAARPPGGKYSGRIRVKLETSEPAEIYFTLDGSEPTTRSSVYQGPIAVERTLVLSFLAVDRVGNRDAVRRESYNLDQTAPSTVAEPAGGTFTGPVTVSLRTEPGAVIRFTLDGGNPTEASPVYREPLRIAKNTVLKFYATGESGAMESAKTERYSFEVTPLVTTIDPAPGIYAKPISISLKVGAVATAWIRLEGEKDYVPYRGPFVLDHSTRISFYSVDPSGGRENPQTVEYVVDQEPPTTIPYPAPGEYNPPIVLEFKSSEEGAKIHYTLDGDEPTLSSQIYGAPLSLREDFTVRFFAVDKAGNREKTRSASYRLRSGLWRDYTNGVFIHPSVLDGDYLWVGEPEGLFRVTLANGKREHYTRDDGLVSDAIRALAVDRLGFKWVGTDKGLSQFDGKRNWVTYDYGDGLASNWINCLVIDQQGNKWVGTDRGLSRYNGKTFTNYTTANGLPDNNVNSLAIDPNGYFWIGTGKGLAKWDTNRVEKVYTKADGLPSDQVTAVAMDGRWNVWVGTKDGGAARFDGKKWVTFGSLEGLGGRGVYTIAVDLADNKWFGTDGGVFKHDGRGFTPVSMPVYR